MRRALVLLASSFILASTLRAPLHAAIFKVYVDADNNTATGCTADLFPGIEQVLITTVDATPSVTAVQQQTCAASVLGPPTAVPPPPTPPWPVGSPPPPDGPSVIETYLPFTPVGPDVRLYVSSGVLSIPPSSDDMTTTSPTSGQAIIFSLPFNPAIPTLDTWGLLLLVAVLGALAVVSLRKRQRVAFMLVCLLAAGATAAFAAIVVDGLITDWAGDTPIATDTFGSDPSPDLRALFVRFESGKLFFRIDASLNQPPTVTTTAGSANFIEDGPAVLVDPGVADADDGTTLTSATVTITNPQDGAAEVLGFGAPCAGLSPAGGGTATVTFSGSASLAAYQACLQSVTYFNSSQNPTALPARVISFVVSDGTSTSAPGTRTVTVTPVNDNPAVNPATFSVPEHTANGTSVGTPVTFTDPETAQNHAFAITAGNTSGAFAIDPTTGQITVANSAALDLTTNPTFSLTVQVTDDGVPPLSGTATVTINVTDVNDPPVVTPATFTVAENTANGTNVGTPVAFTDPDSGQTHTYAITAGNTGGAFAIDPSTGQITVATSSAVDFETTPTFSLTVQVTDNGTPVLSGTATITINVTDANEAPVVNAATFSLPENSANATNVGTPVTFTDPDSGQTHTYAITAGNTGGAFAIDPSTGQITVATSSALDFETSPTFSLTVQVTDNGAPPLSGTATVTVNLTDVNEAPTVNPATFAVAEGSANGTNVGTVTFTDVDAGQTHTFSITAGNTGNVFAINSSTGQITVNGTLDFETTPSYSLTVQVTDNGTPNLSGTGTITVNVSDVNEAPVVNPATFSTPEGTANATNVGTPITFTDGDVGQTHTFAITAGNTGGAFAINAATGQITVANSAALDFETTPTFSLTVQVTDNGAPPASGTATVTINLTDVNEAPVVSPATFAVAEGSPNGTSVGTATFTDSDVGQTHTFAITAGNTGGAFAINPSTGQITVASTLDFETTPSYSLTVQVTDNGTPPLSGTATITVNVTDVNEAPVVNPATLTTPEGTANGTNVGSPVTFTDPDAGQTHTFSITAGNTGGAFAINASTGQITVANSAALDFETTPSFSLTVQVTDNGAPPLSGTATITVNLTDVNEAPVVNPATFTIGENSANGTSVGTATFTDSDVGQTHTFAITAGNTGGAFAINPSTGAITVANSAALDFETNPTFSLTVQVTDNGAPPLSGTATVTVNLTDVNDPPVVNPATFSLAENSANGTNVGTPITFTDQEGGQTHTFAITAGNTGGAFAINAASGQITVANSAAVDFETSPTFSLTVQVTDNGTPAASGTATVTVNLTNVNEAPVVNPATFSLNENSPNGTAVGTVTFTDPDVGQTHTFAITAGNTGGAFAINAASGQITVANVTAVNFEVNPTFSLTVQVTDNGAPVLSGTATITINLNNVPEAPIANPDTYDTIGNTLLQVAATNTATGPHIFVTGSVLANDTDEDVPSTLTTTLNTATAGAVVTINSNGTFTYLPPAGAAGPTDSFTYNLSDGTFTVTGTVTINLKQRAWYVKNNATAGGLGRSADPFDTLVEAQTASSANDYIFVYFGDGTSAGQAAGIVLKAGQHLLGEHAGLAVLIPGPGTFNGTALPTTVNLVAAVPGNRPLIDNSGAGNNAVSATDIIPAEVVGVSLLSTNANAIDWTTTGAFGGTGTFAILNNVIRGAGAEGIDVNAGGTGILTLTSTGNSWNVTGTHTGNAVDINRTGGTFNLDFSSNTNILSAATGVNIVGGATGSMFITGFANNTVHQNTGGTGISISQATFDVTPGGAYQQVSGGTTTIGIAGGGTNGVGASGLQMNALAGDLAFTDLDVFADNGQGVSIVGTGALNQSGGTGTRVTVGAGVGVFEATGGPALALANMTADFQLSSLRSTNSVSAGVSLATLAPALNPAATPSRVSAGATSTINGSTTVGYQVSSSNAIVSYAGTLTVAAGKGVELTSNTGSTIDFTGVLTLNCGGSVGFNATGPGPAATSGGTITATNTSSVVSTSSATALNVVNTTIGTNGLKFQSISAGTPGTGPTNGIALNNTGSSAGLTVSGTGGAGTGGTIQKTGGDGVSLINTLSPSFNNLTINNATGDGVGGTQVTNFTFTNGSINTSGTVGVANTSNIGLNDQAATTERNVSGTVTITGNTFTNAAFHGVDIFNFNGSISDANISNNVFTSTTSTTTSKGSAIRLVASDGASTQADVTKATIDNNVITGFPSGAGIVAQGQSHNGGAGTFGVAGNATNIIAITNNRIAGASAAVKMSINAIQALYDGNGQANFNISNNGTALNPITNVTGNAIVNSAIGSANVTATISGNRITKNDTAGVGGAFGISLGADSILPACAGATCDTPNYHVTVSNNTISQTDGSGIFARSVNNVGSMNIAVLSNNVAAPLSGFREGIQVHSGSSAATGNTSVCAKITGNTSAGAGGADGIGLRKQGTAPATHAYAVEGMAATSSPGVETYVAGLNPASTDGTADADALGVDLISATSGFTNCTFVP